MKNILDDENNFSDGKLKIFYDVWILWGTLYNYGHILKKTEQFDKKF